MLLDSSSLDLDDLEAEIASLLGAEEEVEAVRDRFCGLLEVILARVLRRVPGNRRCRYRDLDDLSCDLMNRADDVTELSGVATWLSGGEQCDYFRIHVALGGKPLLYSYKFINSATAEQILYVGKTPRGWLINGP
jgi:hypothetical protein